MKTIASISITLCILVFIITGCKKNSTPGESSSSCINEKIKKMKSQPVSSPAGSVWQYDYKGQTVYFIPAKCCDIPSVLYDKNCNLLCNPDGGFSGLGDGRCTDFFTERTNEKLIWQDDRK